MVEYRIYELIKLQFKVANIYECKGADRGCAKKLFAYLSPITFHNSDTIVRYTPATILDYSRPASHFDERYITNYVQVLYRVLYECFSGVEVSISNLSSINYYYIKRINNSSQTFL